MNNPDNPNTATLIFKGLSLKQAIMFVKWYEGQGEQDAEVWFDENELPTPTVDMRIPNGYIVNDITETVIVQLK